MNDSLLQQQKSLFRTHNKQNVHNVQQTSYKQFMIMGPGADPITELEILTTQLNKTCTNLSVDSCAKFLCCTTSVKNLELHE